MRKRIAAARWPEDTSFKGWQHGTPIDALRNIMEYWGNGYDWKRISPPLPTIG
ncbi:MAG: epoxide hydrolase N-terminal domain-containing protein [Muribaculaceae bacterium]|nr:epoxide hydrolase N-terminal domain-containing protein [Muribaculaceae bacterium]MDE6643741.1 epoxide hydrolase N-terminal domain-containing protein [Muribaculaceae bacterium]MDE7092563.1 epoxide hydrolase N-terminal domain-containing protein [Muribaculaceae bacterium]